MNFLTMSKVLYDLTASYFEANSEDAVVVWAEQANTKMGVPYVTMKIGNVERHPFSIGTEYEEIGYQCKTKMQVNLYTKGHELALLDVNAVPQYVNTAVADLLDYVDYMDSERTLGKLTKAGISLMQTQDVTDMTSLQNESKYRYRAFVEFEISFVDLISDKYGSGGTAQDPLDFGYFVEAEIEEIVKED